jgi:hypothetical protein
LSDHSDNPKPSSGGESTASFCDTGTSLAASGRAAQQRDELAPFQVIDWHQVPASQAQDIELAGFSQRADCAERLLSRDKLGEWRIWPTTAARQLLDQARNRSVWMTVYLAQVDLANPAARRAHKSSHGHPAVIAARIVG